ncbi:MAG: GAF domain-containing sensor histidine kinase [Chloroflexi bacterium]|nr:MAG: GAF domain-containing sensor histidine kinase [Chloroflexota bacterium]
MATSELPRQSIDQQQHILPELFYSLSALYEIGLATTVGSDLRELYQHILTCLRRVIMAEGACLLLYQPEQQRFVPAATQGAKMSYSALLAELNYDDLMSQVQHGPGETLSTVQAGGRSLIAVTLSYHGVLLGIVALSSTDETVLLDERTPLLATMCHIAALLLTNYNQRTAELKTVVDQERTRIAHDLHDGIAQHLALALLKLEYIQRLLVEPTQPEQALTEVEYSYALLRHCLDELRHGIASLLPPELERQDFVHAWQTLLDDYQANHPDITLTNKMDDLAHLPDALESSAYRFLQETLNNIHKHAQATQVHIHVRRLAHLMFIEVSDNGVGFCPAQAMREHQEDSTMHMGLRTMRERVQAVGGIWKLHSRPGEGTIVQAWFPMAHFFSQ